MHPVNVPRLLPLHEEEIEKVSLSHQEDPPQPSIPIESRLPPRDGCIGNTKGAVLRGAETPQLTAARRLGRLIQHDRVMAQGMPIPGVVQADTVAGRTEIGGQPLVIEHEQHGELVGMPMRAAVPPVLQEEVGLLVLVGAPVTQHRVARGRQVDTRRHGHVVVRQRIKTVEQRLDRIARSLPVGALEHGSVRRVVVPGGGDLVEAGR